MKLYVLLHHYEDDWSLMPNAIAVTDEYTIDTAGTEYWDEEKGRAIAEMGPGSTREICIVVEDQKIIDVLKVPELKGHLSVEKT